MSVKLIIWSSVIESMGLKIKADIEKVQLILKVLILYGHFYYVNKNFYII
jgi:hypothetical protein